MKHAVLITVVFFVIAGILLYKIYGKKKAAYFLIAIMAITYFAATVAVVSVIWVPPGWTDNLTNKEIKTFKESGLAQDGSVMGKIAGTKPAPEQKQSLINVIEEKVSRTETAVYPVTVFKKISNDSDVFKRFGIFTIFFIAFPYYLIFTKLRDTRIHRLFRAEESLRRSKHDAHGSSRWSTEQEILETLIRNGKGIIFGAKGRGRRIQPLALPLDERKRQGLNSHVTVFGPPGSRKSRGYVIPNILQANASYIITDPSGEIYSATAEYLRSQGYTVQIFNLDDPARSDQWNFTIENYNDAMDIANNVIKNTTPPRTGTGDPFWEKAEQSLLQAILLYMWKELPEEQVNFFNLLRLATLEPDELDGLIEELPEEHEARIAFATFLNAPEKTRSSIVLGFSVRLSIFRAPDIAQLTARAAINLHDLGRVKTAIFVIIPEQKSTYEVLSALFFTSAFQALLSVAKREKLSYPIHFILDEFANIGTIPDFQRLLATVRKYGVSVSIILQSINQLKAKYPISGEWESIVGNCDHKVILGVNDVTSAEYFVKLLGRQTIETKYESRKDSVLFDAGNVGWREFGRELLQADELSRLGMNDMILLQRGRFPALLKKYDYSQHPAAKKIIPVNVFDYEPEQEELFLLPLPSRNSCPSAEN